MEQTLAAIGAAGAAIFNPTSGRGVPETLIGVLIVLAFIASLFIPVEESSRAVLVTLTASILSFYFGRKTIEYRKED